MTANTHCTYVSIPYQCCKKKSSLPKAYWTCLAMRVIKSTYLATCSPDGHASGVSLYFFPQSDFLCDPSRYPPQQLDPFSFPDRSERIMRREKTEERAEKKAFEGGPSPPSSPLSPPPPPGGQFLPCAQPWCPSGRLGLLSRSP